MELTHWTGAALDFDGGLIVVGRFEGEAPGQDEKALDGQLEGLLSATAERLLFKGKPRQTVTLDTLGRIAASRIMILGLGEREKADAASLRDLGALAIQEALSHRLTSVGIALPELDTTDVHWIAMGAQLGAYRFTDLQTPQKDEPRAQVKTVALIGGDGDDAALSAASHIATSVNLARTLVNEPANICTPERFAELAQDIASAPGFTLTVYDRKEIIARGMGGIQGVSQGATREPRFIHLAYTPPTGQSSKTIALVGKGLTFDSGGLCIKPAKGMQDMYIDMGGAAAVLGTMHAVSKLQPNVTVHGIVGACENMTGPDAYRPSDVLTMYSGKTVEVLNTDAEGRLVLADCLHYATQLKPDWTVDLATLTGACMVALGPNYAGLFSDDDGLADALLAAAQGSGENLWRLPLDPKLAETLKSKRADLTNLGGPYGGAITAAQFLQNFKGELTWAHMDIAGPTLAAKDDGHIRSGGTGYGVLTLLQLIGSA
ncbi:MAG: leucyl aminopeptidase [Myxococcota bacterium]|nr:leucyl aminopeptidase [Myxococcota bacterium]